MGRAQHLLLEPVLGGKMAGLMVGLAPARPLGLTLPILVLALVVVVVTVAILPAVVALAGTLY